MVDSVQVVAGHKIPSRARTWKNTLHSDRRIDLNGAKGTRRKNSNPNRSTANTELARASSQPSTLSSAQTQALEDKSANQVQPNKISLLYMDDIYRSIDYTVVETLKLAKAIKPEAEFTCDHLSLMKIKKPLADRLNTASRVLVFIDDALLFKDYQFMKVVMSELSKIKSPITLVYPNFDSLRTNREVADEIFAFAKKTGVNNLDTITMHDPVDRLEQDDQGYLRFLGRDLGLPESPETRPLVRDAVETFKSGD